MEDAYRTSGSKEEEMEKVLSILYFIFYNLLYGFVFSLLIPRICTEPDRPAIWVGTGNSGFRVNIISKCRSKEAIESVTTDLKQIDWKGGIITEEAV